MNNIDNKQEIDDKNSTNVNDLDINNMNIEKSTNIIWSALNKASNKGLFNIDESFVIKIAFNNLINEIKKEK